VICLDCISMLICLLWYGSSGVITRYLTMQSGLSVFLWLCLSSGLLSGLYCLWLCKLGAGFACLVLPDLYGTLSGFSLMWVGVVGYVQGLLGAVILGVPLPSLLVGAMLVSVVIISGWWLLFGSLWMSLGVYCLCW